MSLGRAERKPESTSQSRSETPIAALANCWWLSPNRRDSCGVMSSAAHRDRQNRDGQDEAHQLPPIARRDPSAARRARSRLSQALVEPGHDGDPLGLAHRRPGGDLRGRSAAADAQSRQRIEDADVDAGS